MNCGYSLITAFTIHRGTVFFEKKKQINQA